MQPLALELDKFLPFRLSVASNIVSDVIARSYEALFGLRIPEWRLIAVIAEADGLTQQQIGLRTRMDKVTVSRAAIGLADRGLILRTPNPQDGRSHILRLTPAGRELYIQVVPKALDMEAAIFSQFSKEEARSFTAMLDNIVRSADALTGDAPAPPM